MIQQYDQRNDNIKIWIDGILYKREDAKISVFDSLSQGGDAVWEGLRVYNGKVFCLAGVLPRWDLQPRRLGMVGCSLARVKQNLCVSWRPGCLPARLPGLA